MPEVYQPSSIHLAAFSGIISVGLLVLPLVIVGITLASAMRKCFTPITRKRESMKANWQPKGVVGNTIFAVPNEKIWCAKLLIAMSPANAHQFLVGLKFHAGLEFLRLVFRQGGLLRNVARHPK